MGGVKKRGEGQVGVALIMQNKEKKNKSTAAGGNSLKLFAGKTSWGHRKSNKENVKNNLRQTQRGKRLKRPFEEKLKPNKM